MRHIIEGARRWLRESETAQDIFESVTREIIREMAESDSASLEGLDCFRRSFDSANAGNLRIAAEASEFAILFYAPTGLKVGSTSTPHLRQRYLENRKTTQEEPMNPTLHLRSFMFQ